MKNYVYRLFLKDQTSYVGVRSCRCNPEEDDYWGSASDRYVCRDNVVKKEILQVFETRQEAEAFEEAEHRRLGVVENPMFRNRKVGVIGFSMAGETHSSETKNRMSKSHLGKQLSDEHKEKVSQAKRGKSLSTNTSGFVGASYDKSKKHWKARICYQGTNHNLGTYPSPLAASWRYNLALQQIRETGTLDPKSIRNHQFTSP